MQVAIGSAIAAYPAAAREVWAVASDATTAGAERVRAPAVVAAHPVLEAVVAAEASAAAVVVVVVAAASVVEAVVAVVVEVAVVAVAEGGNK